jgi:hypothetical protein
MIQFASDATVTFLASYRLSNVQRLSAFNTTKRQTLQSESFPSDL